MQELYCTVTAHRSCTYAHHSCCTVSTSDTFSVTVHARAHHGQQSSSMLHASMSCLVVPKVCEHRNHWDSHAQHQPAWCACIYQHQSTARIIRYTRLDVCLYTYPLTCCLHVFADTQTHVLARINTHSHAHVYTHGDSH